MRLNVIHYLISCHFLSALPTNTVSMYAFLISPFKLHV